MLRRATSDIDRVAERARVYRRTHGRPHIGQMGSADPPPWKKMDEKLISGNVQKRAVFYVYVIL